LNGERDPAPTSGSRPSLADPLAPRVVLEVEGLSKSFGPVRAVRSLSLDVRAGEVHAVCGHNGAGKSTLVKTLVGLVRPDEGVIRFEGEELSLRNPQDAQSHGIALVNQELSLVPELSVEDNVYLGGVDVPLVYRRRRLSEGAREVLDQLGLRHVQLGTPVETLSIGERQLVEIARLLVRDARLLILDEPTATLSKPEIERVFRATRDLVAQGRSVIFVSHRLDEVFELCDRVTVLRDGQRVATHEIHEIDRRSLIEHMLGEMEGVKTMQEHEHAVPGAEDTVVRIEGLTVPGSVDGVSLALERGIITGLAGQVGSGTSTILRALGGLVPSATGTVEVQGKRVLLNTPRRAAAAGVLYVPNDRQRAGLLLGQAVERNLTVSRLRRLSRLGVLLRRRIRRTARELATMTGVSLERLGSPAGRLCGG
jgi:ABC-type sugar transport system ATPase subunit